MTAIKRIGFALLPLLLAACGSTIGDPCTTNSECMDQICLNTDYAPGGYCSKGCNDDVYSCPTGSTCVHDALGHGTPGCMRTCKTDKECRTSYLCRTQRDSTSPVCVGPAEI